MGKKDNYRYIIDCLLNLPLLYWAADETGEKRFTEIADAHTRTCLEHSIRDDGSTWHTFFMNPIPAQAIAARHARDTKMIPHGHGDRHGRYTVLRSVTSIPAISNASAYSIKLPSIMSPDYLRIWCRIGI